MMFFGPLLQSFLLVATAEMGDKTQLLALILTLKFRNPLPVLAGIFFATIINHGIATWAGVELAEMIPADVLRYSLALIFILFACWVLIPDKDDGLDRESRFGAFLTTFVAFFLAEMGDKTQLATVALAARYQDMLWVTVGSTTGMLFTNGLTVFFGEKILKIIPLRYVRWAAAFLFLIFGVAILLG